MTFIYYHYTPTLVGAVLFILLFSTITLAHLFQLLRFRAWFMIPVLIGGISLYPLPLSAPRQITPFLQSKSPPTSVAPSPISTPNL